MTTRDEYVEQFKNKLDEWNHDIAKCEEKARAKKNDLTINYEIMKKENV